jgi:C4-type Zn-finger protein
MEPKCPSCGEFACATIHGVEHDVPVDAASALPTLMLYCRKCGYTFAVLPLIKEVRTIMREGTEEIQRFDREQLWSVVRYVPKPEWVR